jgi:hypothetical protein
MVSGSLDSQIIIFLKRRAAPEEQSRRSSFSYLPLPPLEPLPLPELPLEPLPLLPLLPEPPPEPPFEPLPPPFVVEPVLAEPPEGWLKAVGRVVEAM